MNQKSIFNIFLVAVIVAVSASGAYFLYRNNDRATIRQIPPTIFTVNAYALEKNGGHIFDGATIAAIDQVSGKILSEQIADQNGRVIFYLKPGAYRFQPSPLKESRVVGFLDVDIKKNQELTLQLTEIGPTAFGAPVQTCDAKKDAINLALETANYCETDSDCKLFEPVGFSCWTYIHKSFNTSTILQRIADYGESCDTIKYKCAVVGQALCMKGKCKVDYK